MSPITHFLAGWAVANSAQLNRRERLLVTLAGVAPDLDGLGLVAEILTRHSAHPLNWWSDYHHVFGHNLLFCLLVAAVAFAAATRRALTAGLALVSVHLHLVCDLVGARGPDGYIWTIPYLWPLSADGVWSWSGQWALNAWPNMVITALLIAFALWVGWRRGCTPLEMISARADQAVVNVLRQRLGPPGS